MAVVIRFTYSNKYYRGFKQTNRGFNCLPNTREIELAKKIENAQIAERAMAHIGVKRSAFEIIEV